MTKDKTADKTAELTRLRNRHVAKVLTFLGETPPYVEAAIKRAFSMFSRDVETNIINSDHRYNNDRYRSEEEN